jgi:hypothetical protein
MGPKKVALSLAIGALLAVSFIIAGRSASPRAGDAQVFDEDARLSPLIRLEIRHQPLDDALRLISEQTHVTLSAEGKAADLRVTAFVSEQPARSVLLRLSLLLHLTWRRAGEGEKSKYTLYMSEKDQSAVEAAKAAEWEAFRANIRRLIRAALQPGAASSDPRDRAAQGIVSNRTGRAAGLVLAGFPEAVLDQALRGEVVRVPFARLSPGQQEALRGYQATLHAELTTLEDQASQGVSEEDRGRILLTPPRDPEPVEQGGVELKVDRRMGDGQNAQLAITLLGSGGRGVGIRLGIIPSASLTIDEQLRIPRHFETRQCAKPLTTALKLPAANLPWEEALARFARDNHLSILSDAFDRESIAPSIHPTIWAPGAAVPAEQILDRLCLPYDTTWNASEPVLLFRQRDWYLERERQIPERLARRWRKMAREQGLYPFDELARMATLNEAQRQRLWRYAGVRTMETVQRNLEALRLCAALRPEQQALAEGDGLEINLLDLQQQKLLPPLLARVRPGPLDLRCSCVRLRVLELPEEPTGTLLLIFRDGERRSIRLDRTAKPPPDPWNAKFSFR